MTGPTERSETIAQHQKDPTGLRNPFVVIWSVLFILLLISGCKPGSKGPQPSSKTESNVSSSADSTELPFSINIPTPTISNGNSPATPGDSQTYLYTQPEGWFTVQAPKDWLVEQAPGGVRFTAPQGGQQIVVNVVNTGYPLDIDTFSALVDNREAFNARQWQGYVEIDRRFTAQEDRVLVSKSYIDSDRMRRGESLYRFDGRNVFIVDYWAAQDGGLIDQDLFSAVYSSISLNAEAVASLPIYAFGQSDVKSNGYFSILISPYWDFHRLGGDFSLVETYTSPDEHAVVQTIIYDDGKFITNNVAGELTLSLLKNSYTTEIRLVKDEVLKDGREKLTWSSLDNSYQGITSFITKGSGLYILTLMWDNDPELYYQTILEEVFLSFTLDNPSD